MPQTIIKALREENGFQFLLHGQPIKPVGATAETEPDWYEMLLRLKDPTQIGLQTPINFMPNEDRYDLLLAIDYWVLHRAAEIMQAHPELKISINFTKYLLHVPLLRHRITEIFAGIDTRKRLVLEVSEKYILNEFEVEKLADVSLIVGLEIDDIGEANLTNLVRLPITGFKLDGKLVQAVYRNPRAAELVRTLISFAQASDLTCVCEFVSNRSIWRWLQDVSWQYPHAKIYVQGHAVGDYRRDWDC